MKSKHQSIFKPSLNIKTWNPEIEASLFQRWQDEKIYNFNQKSKKPIFSIDTPPPYVNTPVHIGQAYTYVWMDIFARYNRMIGHNILFPMGLDKNGLPVEVQTEKIFGISMHETPREEFIMKCKEILKASGDHSLDTFKRLGLSCNSWKLVHNLGGRYETDNPKFRQLTQATFIEFWRKGLIYEDKKTTNYCPTCGTTISDAEVEYEEKETELFYIKFKVQEKDSEIVIATTRPELLCSCKTVIFNQNDERYQDLEGNHAIVPIFKHLVKIQSHPYAKPEFGSGLVMICSFGDYSDVRILRELHLEPIYSIDKKGRMNHNAGKYKGLKVKEAQKKIISDLESQDLIVKKELLKQRIPICWRSKNPIEFVPMKEMYLKQVEYKDELLQISDKMRYFSPESKQILIDWINAVGIDWVISRRRYYGTEIPLWYCKKCGEVYVPEPGAYYQPWREKPPVADCPKCGSVEFIGEERTLDTWFDSATTEAYILGFLWNQDFFKKKFPCTLRPQGKEIVRNWLYFTILKSFLLFKKPPFRDVWIHMHVVDEEGRKMSKSAGNSIDPQEIINNLGAEAFRIWSSLEGNITKGDIRCSIERIQGTSKFLTKLWNIARFISSFPQINKDFELAPLDKMILSNLNEIIKECRSGYEEMNAFKVATLIRTFTWNNLADHYIEAAKSRAYNHGNMFSTKLQRGAWFMLHQCLKTILKLLAPVIPFITDSLWLELYSKESIHIQRFPKEKPEWESDITKLVPNLIEFNTSIWKYKKKKGLALSQELSNKIYTPNILEPLKEDLNAMHKIKNLNIGKPENIDSFEELSEGVFIEK
jgi:valyl-tRNA synthetase